MPSSAFSISKIALPECGVNGDTCKLNPAIVKLWAHCLRQYARPDIKNYVKLPDQSLLPNNWFATYVNVIHNLLAKNIIPVRFLGLNYPKAADANPIYIENLPTPKPPQTISYADLFEFTRQKLILAWTELAQAFNQDDPDLFKLPNADLDIAVPRHFRHTSPHVTQQRKPKPCYAWPWPVGKSKATTFG